jgi:SpoVK/Ycf46/Vps4 family AAA+-type ATPase
MCVLCWCGVLVSQVSFYMRKGADLLSKWVGEAEKQLRLLFEEASKHQPAIIFFDEIDGLAPVSTTACFPYLITWLTVQYVGST